MRRESRRSWSPGARWRTCSVREAWPPLWPACVPERARQPEVWPGHELPPEDASVFLAAPGFGRHLGSGLRGHEGHPGRGPDQLDPDHPLRGGWSGPDVCALRGTDFGGADPAGCGPGFPALCRLRRPDLGADLHYRQQECPDHLDLRRAGAVLRVVDPAPQGGAARPAGGGHGLRRAGGPLASRGVRGQSWRLPDPGLGLRLRPAHHHGWGCTPRITR